MDPTTESGAISPDIGRVIAAYPHGRSRGRLLDWLRLRYHKFRRRRLGLGGDVPTRPHRVVLTGAAQEALRAWPEPVCIETGCIRNPGEGTDSTLAIAGALGDRGILYTFELDPDHIAICREVCTEFEERIRYVQGDARANLARLRGEGVLDVIHLAFFDSAEDADQIWGEFRAVEDLFVPGSLVVVDDVIYPSVKGRRLLPYLSRHSDWDTCVLFAWHGMLVAVRR